MLDGLWVEPVRFNREITGLPFDVEEHPMNRHLAAYVIGWQERPRSLV